MNNEKRNPVLTIRVKGSATVGGRISLQNLLSIGKHLQLSIERVARVLVGAADSKRRGRNPSEIAHSCALEVRAVSKGSFEIAFDLPRDTFEDMDLGLDSLEKLLEGFEKVGTNGDMLPVGYDIGVLHSLRDMGSILGSGIEEIEMESKTPRLNRLFCFNQDVRKHIIERIRGPISNLRTIEGRLIMADFKHNNERCRIHPPSGEPILCDFHESLEETIYEYLRSSVRITGETEEEPETGRIRKIQITDIEPLTMEVENYGPVTPDTFWKESTLSELALEQDVKPVRQIEDVFGKGANLWENDDDFESFLAATRGCWTKEG